MSSQIAIPLVVVLLAAFWFVVAHRSRATNPGTAKLALVGGILATLLGIAVTAVILPGITISAVIAIPMFVTVIVEYGLIIALVSRVAGGHVPQRPFLISVLVIIAGIVIGIILMFQPWTPMLFNPGFDLVFISLLAFIVWSHVTPKNAVTR